jgi:hypothetical protein
MSHLIDAPGNAPYSLNSYGETLRSNKDKLARACDAANISWEHRIIMYAMAMQETVTFSSADRDASKDGMGDAANVSMFNLSLDFVKSAGYGGDPWSLNRDEHMADAVTTIRMAFESWGIDRALNFVRGGRTGFVDGTSYGVHDFRNSIKSIARVIESDASLLADDRRVDVYLVHV